MIRDCAEDGDLDGDYTQEELDEAHKDMPSDIDEYSNCREVIESAREQSGGGGGDNNAGSPPVAQAVARQAEPAARRAARGPTPRRSGRALETAAATNAPTASVAGEDVSSSGGTYATDAAESDGIPTALIVALILVALGALAGAVYLLRDHLPPAIASRLPGPLKPDSQV